MASQEVHVQVPSVNDSVNEIKQATGAYTDPAMNVNSIQI